MLNHEEYEQIIRVFLVELHHLCLNASPEELQALPRFAEELESYLADFRDPSRDAAKSLYTAFGFLDEYLNADWQNVIDKSFHAYQRMSGSIE